MYNPYQPFMNLINANLSLINRFANSNDITRLVQESVNRTISISKESVEKATRSDAFEELTRGLADNVARFTQEYLYTISQSIAQTQVLSRQVEQGTRQFAKITAETAEEASEDVAQDSGLRLAKSGNERERNSRQSKQ